MPNLQMHSSPKIPPYKTNHSNRGTAHNVWKYSEQPLFITLKSNNLKSILVRAAYKPTEENRITITTTCQPPSNEPKHSLQKPQYKTPRPLKNAKKPRCATCLHYNDSEYFQSTATRKLFKIRHSSRATQTVIYLITCANCKKQYVGKTTRTLRYRVCQHRHSIKKPICGIGENRPSGAKTQKKSYLYHVVALTLLYLLVLVALQSVLLFPSYKGKRVDHLQTK